MFSEQLDNRSIDEQLFGGQPAANVPSSPYNGTPKGDLFIRSFHRYSRRFERQKSANGFGDVDSRAVSKSSRKYSGDFGTAKGLERSSMSLNCNNTSSSDHGKSFVANE